MFGLELYCKSVLGLMRIVMGISVTVSGQEHIPSGVAIIASKHQSYADGFVMFAAIKDLSFVTGAHLEKSTLVKRILRKIGAVVVDQCGGKDAQDRLARYSQRVIADGRKLLIYPEGRTVEVGDSARYRKGVFHLYEDFGCAVVPVATNMGLRWPRNFWRKYSGPAHVQFLPPIEAGLDKDTFMARLEQEIEAGSAALLDPALIGSHSGHRVDAANHSVGE